MSDAAPQQPDDDSLIEADKLQGELFYCDASTASLHDIEIKGRSTGERIFSQNRRLYDATVRLDALELPSTTIAEVLGINASTVQSILNREPQAIQLFKGKLAKRWRSVASMTIERIEALISDPDSDVSPELLHKIARESAEIARALSEESAGLEDTAMHETMEDVDEHLKALPSKKLPGDVIDVETVEMGSGDLGTVEVHKPTGKPARKDSETEGDE